MGVTEGCRTFNSMNCLSQPKIVLEKACLETSKAVRELRSQLMPSRHYLFMPFLRTKSQMRLTKIFSSEKSYKKDHGKNIIATNSV